MGQMGDHALTCPSAGLYRRHNIVRDAIYRLAHEAGWAPELEVTLPSGGDRPADILCRATFGKPLAIDVTITHPLRLSASSATRGEVASAAEAAEARKRLASAEICSVAGWGFRPMALETTGGLGSGASQTLRQLCRYLSMKTGTSSGELSHSVSRAISLALAKGKGEMLSAARPGEL